MDAQMEALAAQEHERARIAAELLSHDPTLGGITALIMSGDILSAKRARAMLEAGEVTAEQSVVFVGSYSRLGYIIDLLDEGKLTPEWVYARLADEWSGSDPDDTDPRFLLHWRRAWEANGRQPLTDEGKALPAQDVLTIYRGQDVGDVSGIAWSLDRQVAERFAKGAALRQAHRPGIVIKRMVWREQVLGYMTGRKEAEVIVDPVDLR